MSTMDKLLLLVQWFEATTWFFDQISGLLAQ
jgi:hypothetical protein